MICLKSYCTYLLFYIVDDDLFSSDGWNMRNKKLIPFEVIEKAVAGEMEAVDVVLRHYTAHIKYLFMYGISMTICRIG